MKLEKKHWAMLIVGVVVLFLIYWFFFRKKKSESSFNENILVFGNDSSYDPDFPTIGESGYRVKPTGPIRSGAKSCPCPKGATSGAIYSPKCCDESQAHLACHTAGGWNPCYWCNSWDSQGNCNGWVTKCCKGGSVRNMSQTGFGSSYTGESGYAISRRKCEKCKGNCTPPCTGTCAEYVDCPGGVGVPSIPF